MIIQTSDFPAPGLEAMSHSSELLKHIRSVIEDSDGWISFAEYMNMVLYTPGLGYYSAGAKKLGQLGDFVTAPELSPLFSKCLGVQIAKILENFSSGSVLELGAGLGTMAADLLIELERLDVIPEQYLILETSADLRSRQMSTIQEKAPHLVDYVHWLDGIPESKINGVVIANEVIDALPVSRFVVDPSQASQISELGVIYSEGKLKSSVHPPSSNLLRALRPVLESSEFKFPSGYTSEVNINLSKWIASISDWINQGAFLIFDYGFSRSEYYHPDRASGTLRCFYKHRAHEDPFFWPGLQDISSWVDFTLIAESADASGFDVSSYTTQAQFLLASDIEAHLEPKKISSRPEQLSTLQGLKRLILPGEMGEAIKVMSLTRGNIQLPDGIKGRDMRGSL